MALVVFLIFVAYWSVCLSTVSYLLGKKKKKAAVATGTFFFLFSTWDVLVGFLFVFVPASIFWAGNTIERQVATDTIYYDDSYLTYGPSKIRRFDYFSNKNKYAEMKVAEIRKSSVVKEKGLYRFWLDETDSLKFEKIDEISARYTIQTPKGKKMSIVPIRFYSTIIIDRNTNEIIARGNLVTLYYKPVLNIPFFSWVPWHDRSRSMYSDSDPEDIERNTINP